MRSPVRCTCRRQNSWPILALLLACVLTIAHEARPQNASYLNLTVTDLNGNDRTVKEYLEDGPVYVTFWALWCVPCLNELRALRSMVAEHSGGKFTILAVNRDSPRSLAKVKSYVFSQEFPFPVVLDPNAQLFQAFNGQVLPLGILLSRDGSIAATRTGYIPGDEKEIEKLITDLIEKEEPR